MTLRLTVYESGGKHYASRTFPILGGEDVSFPNVVFSVEGDPSQPNEIDRLEREARQKARDHHIDHVINLD